MCKRNSEPFKKGKKKRETHPTESPKPAYSKVAGMATDRSSYARDVYMFSERIKGYCK